MDAKELRIGNLVQTPRGIYPVGIISYSGVHVWTTRIHPTMLLMPNSHGFDEYRLEIIQPIPISPEWLERLGAVKDGADSLYFIVTPEYDYPGKYIELHFTKGMRLAMWAGKDTDGLIIEHVRYVHQLQNLYYALTGEELQIKEG